MKEFSMKWKKKTENDAYLNLLKWSKLCIETWPLSFSVLKPIPPVYFRILKTQRGAISLINHPIRVQRFSKSHTHTTVKLDEEPHADLPSQYPNLEGRYQYKNTLNTAINISKRRKDLTIWSLIVLPSCSTIWIFYKAQTKTKIEISRKNQNQTQMTKKKS